MRACRLGHGLTSLRSIHEASAPSSLGVNLNGAKLTLTSGVAILTQTVLLLGGCVLLCRHNTSVLVKYKVALGKTTGGLVGGIMPHLGARPL